MILVLLHGAAKYSLHEFLVSSTCVQDCFLLFKFKFTFHKESARNAITQNKTKDCKKTAKASTNKNGKSFFF